MDQSHVVVDGSNIATEGRSLPSLAQLDEAVRAFLAERPHEICTVVVDATFEHRIDSSEKQMYDEALAANELLTPPAGSIGRGDKFILEIADRVGATVFSNDSFQEFHGEYDWLFDQGRLVGGKPVPGVGWVFIERTPVRGPKSRMATRAAGKKRARGAAGSAAKRTEHAGPTSSGVELGPMPTPKTPPPTKKQQAADDDAAAAEANGAGDGRGRRRKRGGRGRSGPAPEAEVPTQDAVNSPLPFIEFVAEHQPGSTVVGEVVEFSSHGAYVQVGDVRCYAPLKLLGDPTPRSAREVLEKGDTREFVVHAIHASRRGVDLALTGVASAVPGLPAAEDGIDSEEVAPPEAAAPAKKRSSRSTKATRETEAAATADATDQAPATTGAEQPESEATLAATKKAAAKKTAAKKTTAKKSTAAKKASPAKKAATAAAKATTAAKKATATAKKTVKKATTAAKKTTAKKAPATKATAKKSTTAAKKAPAKATTAKKTTAATKAPAKKATAAKKTTAKKTTAKKAAAKKA